MEDYVTPTLNQISFGFGFAVVLFSWVYLLAGSTAIWAYLQKAPKALPAGVAALNVLPFAVLAVIGWATGANVDIGPRTGAMAQLLEGFYWFATFAGPVAAVLMVAIVLLRRLGSERGGHAHS